VLYGTGRIEVPASEGSAPRYWLLCRYKPVVERSDTTGQRSPPSTSTPKGCQLNDGVRQLFIARRMNASSAFQGIGMSRLVLAPLRGANI